MVSALPGCQAVLTTLLGKHRMPETRYTGMFAADLDEAQTQTALQQRLLVFDRCFMQDT